MKDWEVVGWRIIEWGWMNKKGEDYGRERKWINKLMKEGWMREWMNERISDWTNAWLNK